MKPISVTNQRNIDAGASKYVKCPVCGHNYKTTLLERIFKRDSTIEGYLQSRHGQLRNLRNLSTWASSSVHVR